MAEWETCLALGHANTKVPLRRINLGACMPCNCNPQALTVREDSVCMCVSGRNTPLLQAKTPVHDGRHLGPGLNHRCALVVMCHVVS